ncbi:hypothetical protein F0562_033053 [Nyssa sinensis]|uniref:CCHC-type domain-containing protein n=1 Tax=Nyssa sinensis TaxID=561372 RepID=A0A5J5AQF6_9ASTE|nr:hypothetical protein F0562_033053 [Nyssa sinensis]
MQSYGEKISDETIVAKNEEKAFQVKDIVTKAAESDSSTSRGRGRGGFRGRGRGNERGRGRFDGQRQSGEQTNNKNGVQCYHCKKYGHIKADCWYKDQQVNYAAENGEESSKLFMTHFDPNKKSSDVWFVDSGCSNHMTGMKSLFKELDETQKLKVQLGNAKEMQVEGKGTVGIETTHVRVLMPWLGFTGSGTGSLGSGYYSTQSKAYRLYNPLSGKILIRRDVVFDENASWDWRGSGEKMQQQVPMSIGISPNASQEPTPTSSSGSSMASPSSSASTSPSRDSSSTLEESSDETPPRKFRSLRDIYESC